LLFGGFPAAGRYGNVFREAFRGIIRFRSLPGATFSGFLNRAGNSVTFPREK